MSMLTFVAASCHKMANCFSLKLSVSAIIKNTKIVGADLQRTNIGDMKIINNHIDPLNIK